jgi:hypothetical protein
VVEMRRIPVVLVLLLAATVLPAIKRQTPLRIGRER